MGYKRYIEGLPDPSPISTKSLPMDEFICMQSGLCGHKWVAEEAAMFEGAQEQKQSSSNHMLLTILVVLAAAGGDVLYPAGTAWYKFRITGATPAAAQ